MDIGYYYIFLQIYIHLQQQQQIFTMKSPSFCFNNVFVSESASPLSSSSSFSNTTATTTTTTRKRCRSRQGTFAPAAAVVVVAAVAVFSALVPSATGFSILSSPTTLPRQLHVLHVSATAKVVARPRRAGYGSSGAAVATRVKPKESISDEKRLRALKAMNGNHKVDSALQGVDAQVLELLSEHFLYPDSVSASVAAAKVRPKGRPDFVPGAMNYETMLRFREKQEVIKIVGNRGHQSNANSDSTVAPYSTALAPSNHLGDGDVDVSSSTTTATKSSRGIKGATTKAVNGIAEVGNNDQVPKRRKRVVKSLPAPRAEVDKRRKKRINGKTIQRKRTKGSNLELHKYYRTELLGADEEYSLVMKVNLMVKCESVHEGLSTSLMRLPTIQEWAAACG